eukprot:scaffold34933_cov46-Prasinocladus_malaysianus.AAC.1
MLLLYTTKVSAIVTRTINAPESSYFSSHVGTPRSGERWDFEHTPYNSNLKPGMGLCFLRPFGFYSCTELLLEVKMRGSEWSTSARETGSSVGAARGVGESGKQAKK